VGMAIDRNGTGQGAVAELSLADVIEIKLPPTSEYLAVVRATIGVIAGNMSFNYDEVIQLRVAVSEVFNLAAEWIAEDAEPLDTRELALRFVVDGNKLEILIPNQISHAVSLTGDQMVESKALLESLMDEVEIGEEVGQDPLIRIAKYNTSDTS